jgi:RNA polymerase sigma factor (sigma-70 family)
LSSIELPAAYLRVSAVNGARSGIRRQRTADAHAHTLIEGRSEQPRDVELRDVLLRLPHRQRAAVVLRYYCQLSDPDIAEILGCRPATVRSLTRRALANLRRELRCER